MTFSKATSFATPAATTLEPLAIAKIRQYRITYNEPKRKMLLTPIFCDVGIRSSQICGIISGVKRGKKNRTDGKGRQRIRTVQHIRNPLSMIFRSPITVSNHIRPCLRYDHCVSVDARVNSCSPAGPIDGNRETLKQIAQEKCYSPNDDDKDHGMHDIYDSTVGENA